MIEKSWKESPSIFAPVAASSLLHTHTCTRLWICTHICTHTRMHAHATPTLRICFVQQSWAAVLAQHSLYTCFGRCWLAGICQCIISKDPCSAMFGGLRDDQANSVSKTLAHLYGRATTWLCLLCISRTAKPVCLLAVSTLHFELFWIILNCGDLKSSHLVYLSTPCVKVSKEETSIQQESEVMTVRMVQQSLVLPTHVANRDFTPKACSNELQTCSWPDAILYHDFMLSDSRVAVITSQPSHWNVHLV